LERWAAVIRQDVHRSTRGELQTERGSDPRANPILELCERLINLAFRDAARTYRGQPTTIALEAREWIEFRSNWTRVPLQKRLEVWGQPAPPPDVRTEYPGTFDWACAWLSEDCDHVREFGLPKKVSSEKSRQVFGMRDVRQRLAKAAEQWAVKVVDGTVARDDLAASQRRETKNARARRAREAMRSPCPPVTCAWTQHANAYASYRAYAMHLGSPVLLEAQWRIPTRS